MSNSARRATTLLSHLSPPSPSPSSSSSPSPSSSSSSSSPSSSSPSSLYDTRAERMISRWKGAGGGGEESKEVRERKNAMIRERGQYVTSRKAEEEKRSGDFYEERPKKLPVWGRCQVTNSLSLSNSSASFSLTSVPKWNEILIPSL